MTGQGIILSGIGAAPGSALGPAWLVLPPADRAWQRELIEESCIESELKWVRSALAQARLELTAIAVHASETMEEAEAAIFRAHLLFLDDPSLMEMVESSIRVHRRSAPWAVDEAFSAFAELLRSQGDEYMRQRAADIREVGERVLFCLTGLPSNEPELPVGAIVVAKDLGPAQTISFARSRLAGLVTALGSETSHTAIIARSLGIPAVVGVAGILGAVHNGDYLALDGNTGQIVVNPSADTRERYDRLRAAEKAAREKLQHLVHLDAVTLDGRKIELWANIGKPGEADEALSDGARGIGLFRTEFLYMGRDGIPGEEEQEAAYRHALAAMQGRPVVIRTLDIGGDKQLPYLALPREENPSLGVRAIRLSLREVDLFRTQLRALWRASSAGNLWVMFPMISTQEELREAKRLSYEVREELLAQGMAVADHIKIGLMIETPAAAMIADLLAAEVDFFSIGTNDLIQYTIAADRQNDRLAALYQPAHPAVLRLIARTVEAGHARGIPVGMCGEMAGDPRFTELLVGLGLDELSMSIASLIRVKERIRGIRSVDATHTAVQALNPGAS